MSQPLLTLKNIQKTYNGIDVLQGFDLEIKQGEFLTLLGPSGCGKTTVLRLIGGFEGSDAGEMVMDGVRINDLPPHERTVNTVFQSYALFPHMDVFENVAFGLRMKKMPEAQIQSAVKEALEMVQLGAHERKRPAQLSGGQQQRVAIARAVVNKPHILLLDESLSALDYKLRKQMQIELKALQRRLGITFLFVTHDQEEALSMSDRIVVMNAGRIEQIGTPKEIYEEPRTLFVANFIGEANTFTCNLIEQREGEVLLGYGGRSFCVKTSKTPSARATLLIRPEDLRVERRLEDVKSPNYFEAVLEQIIYKGTTIDLLLRLDEGREIMASEFYNEDSDALLYQEGERLYLYWVDGWEVLLNEAE